MVKDILNRSWFYYLLLLFVVFNGIDIATIHLLRLVHLRAQYEWDVLPCTQQKILFDDYKIHHF